MADEQYRKAYNTGWLAGKRDANGGQFWAGHRAGTEEERLRWRPWVRLLLALWALSALGAMVAFALRGA